MNLSSIIEQFRSQCQALGLEPTEDWLYASIEAQKLLHIKGDALHTSYPISTSKNPPSCIEDSFGTPWGMHKIGEKIGNGAPLGSVFRGRIPSGMAYWEEPEEEQAKSLITTRILRLHGLEPGVNQGPGRDTFERYVYIHGTNKEDAIGTPASKGCLQMTNEDVIELFDTIQEDSLLWIQ